jgi:ATP-binding cassette subfamily B protein
VPDNALAHDDIVGKAYDARLMRRLLTYLRPHGRMVAVAFGVILVSSVSDLAQPWLTQIAIDRHIAAGDGRGLMRVAAVFLAMLLIGFAAEYATTFIVQSIGQRVMRTIRIQVYAHLQTLDVRFYDRNPVGRLMTRVTTDVDALNDLFTSGVITIFGDMLVLVGITVAMLAMNWRLALVALVVIPLIGWAAQWFRRNVRES